MKFHFKHKEKKVLTNNLSKKYNNFISIRKKSEWNVEPLNMES